jgi:hypothetical protein
VSTYSAEQILRILPSVFDVQGFYDRGGRHAPTSNGEENEGVTSRSIDVHAGSTPIAERLDVANAVARLPRGMRRLLQDVATRPLKDMRNLYGPDWHKLTHGACQALAEDT